MRYTTARFGEVAHLLGEFSKGRRPAQSFTIVDLGTERAIISGHGYQTGDGPHRLSTTGTLPTPLSGNVDYWLISGSTSGVAFATSRQNALDGTAVDLTASGTGTHTIDNPVTVKLIDLSSLALVPLDEEDCSEVVALSGDTFSTYVWPTSNITTPPTDQTELLYQMQDAYTGRTQKGKLVVGGFPDESARRRHQNEIHINNGAGVTLATLESVTDSLTFTSPGGGSPDTLERGSAWPSAIRVGQRLQVTTGSNVCVTSPITALSGNALLFAESNGKSDGAFTPVTESATVVLKDLTPAGNGGALVGTEETPAANLLDARLIAEDLQLTTYHLLGGTAITMDFRHRDWSWIGSDPESDIVTLQASGNVRSSFENVGIRGDLSGRISATECIIGASAGTVTGVRGVFSRCGARGTWVLASGAEVRSLDLAAADITGLTVDYSAGGAPQFLAGSVLGIFTFENMDQPLAVLGMTALGAEITLAASVASGIIELGGVGELTNNAGPGIALDDNLIKASALNAKAEPGDAMDLVADAVDAAALAADAVAEIADGVWDEAISGHAGAGSAGRNLWDARRHITNSREIDRTATPAWEEVVYDDDGTTELQRATLSGGDATVDNISDSNRPAGVLVSKRTVQ